MSAYLLAMINRTTLKVEGVMLASQPVGSMTSSSKTSYAELIKFDGKDYSDARRIMLEWMVDTYEHNPLKWAIPLLLQRELGELGYITQPQAEIDITVKVDSPYEHQLSLLMKLWAMTARVI